MFFTVTDPSTEKQYSVNIAHIISVEDGNDIKTDPKFELYVTEENGSQIIESFQTKEERDQRRDQIVECGNFFIVSDTSYSTHYVQSISKIEVGDNIENNISTKPMCLIKFVNGQTKLAAFEDEEQRNEFYDKLIAEQDPTVPPYVKGITESDIRRWNSALQKEDDPTVPSFIKQIKQQEISNWNNHIEDSSIHVEQQDKDKWNGIEEALKQIEDLKQRVTSLEEELEKLKPVE